MGDEQWEQWSGEDWRRIAKSLDEMTMNMEKDNTISVTRLSTNTTSTTQKETNAKVYEMHTNDGTARMSFTIGKEVGTVCYFLPGCYISEPFYLNNKEWVPGQSYTLSKLKELWIDLRKSPAWDRGEVRCRDI